MRSTRIGATLAGALMAGSLLGSTAIAQSPEMPTGEMSAEDRAAIDAVAAGMLESAAELPAVYLGVWDPERGAYVAAYGTADRETGRPASVEDLGRWAASRAGSSTLSEELAATRLESLQVRPVCP